MKLVNTTHLSKHANPKDAKAVFFMLSRYTTMKTQHGYCKVIKENGNIYYSKVKTKFFNVNEAIKALNDVKDKPFQNQRVPNYTNAIRILECVKQDRIKHGDMVPDTTDTYKELHQKSIRYVSKNTHDMKSSRLCRVKKKKDKQKDFIEKFNKAVYGEQK